MKKRNRIEEIKYWFKAVFAAIRGKEIDFAVDQIEKWFKGEIVSQKITNSVYGSDVFMELSNDWCKKETKSFISGKEIDNGND